MLQEEHETVDLIQVRNTESWTVTSACQETQKKQLVLDKENQLTAFQMKRQPGILLTEINSKVVLTLVRAEYQSQKCTNIVFTPIR